MALGPVENGGRDQSSVWALPGQCWLSGPALWLLADTELADDVAVAIGIVRLQVVQKAAALADQLQKTAPGSVVLSVRLEVFGQFADARTQNRNLDLRRAGVRIMGAEAFNQGCFLCSRQHGVGYSSCLLSPLVSVSKERLPRMSGARHAIGQS